MSDCSYSPAILKELKGSPCIQPGIQSPALTINMDLVQEISVLDPSNLAFEDPMRDSVDEDLHEPSDLHKRFPTGEKSRPKGNARRRPNDKRLVASSKCHKRRVSLNEVQKHENKNIQTTTSNDSFRTFKTSGSQMGWDGYIVCERTLKRKGRGRLCKHYLVEWSPT